MIDLVGLSVVDLMVDSGSGFVPQPMFDDGLSGDGVAGDGVFGSEISPQTSGTLVRYYIQATDSAVQTTTYPCWTRCRPTVP